MAQYYIEKNNDSVGPFALEQLVENGVSQNTQVWSSTTGVWKLAGAIPEVAALIGVENQFIGVRPAMGFWETVRCCYQNRFDFSGRARRNEYWFFMLFVMGLIFVVRLLALTFTVGIMLLDSTLVATFMLPILYVMIIVPLIAVIGPLMSVSVRRLHDTNHSGFWFYAYFIPASLIVLMALGSFQYANSIDEIVRSIPELLSYGIVVMMVVSGFVMFIYSCLDSDPEANDYGPSPKYQ